MNAALTTTHASTPITMSSRDIADLVDKRHDNVKRTIDTLIERGVISHPQVEDGPRAANGVTERIYRIGKRDSHVIVAQLSPEFTARLVDRWQELETKQAQAPLPVLTTAQMLVAIATQAAEQEQRMLALSTKVEQVEQRLDELSEVPKLPYYLAMPAGYANRSRIRAAAHQRHGMNAQVVDFVLDTWEGRPAPKVQVRNCHPNAGESTSIAWLEREVNDALARFVGGCIKASTQQVTHPAYGKGRFKLATGHAQALPKAA